MFYNMNTLTIDQLKDLIASADDSYDSQIRVDDNGDVYISRDVGSENLNGVKFRFESFDEGNGYVGIKAAKDQEYINKTYRTLMKAWKDDMNGYIDSYL